MRNLVDAYLSTWISSIGDYVRSFEHAFAGKAGAAHGVATSNGTVSLHLALAALGIGEGDDVIVPDFTFAASANTVIHVGARPILTDVDPDTWCLSPEAIEKAITPRTRAIMPVHVFGRPAPMTEIAALAKAHGLFVIEDCAEAHGARYDGKPVGSLSATRLLLLLRQQDHHDRRRRHLRHQQSRAGRQNAHVARPWHGPDRRYWHEVTGFNYRMTNLQAAIGCAQLERIDELIAMRRNVGDLYEAVLADVPGIALPPAMSARCEPVGAGSHARRRQPRSAPL